VKQDSSLLGELGKENLDEVILGQAFELVGELRLLADWTSETLWDSLHGWGLHN